MYLTKTYGNCCGHRVIEEVESITLAQLKKLVKEGHDPYTGQPCGSFSWIATEYQAKESAELKHKFELLKFTVTTVRLGRNPKSGNRLHMRIALLNAVK